MISRILNTVRGVLGSGEEYERIMCIKIGRGTTKDN